ncbi:TadE/TadG family type IV pilus assembly protein [Pseudomonas sp. NPDC089734]|uniref:TadE/TadG family type IV pilus assembly protein n=1 Tax=Pseudomonas sp. NPDC089734 TaxID=3364469 RepID=UPI0037F750FC
MIKRTQQRGSALLETALALPIILGTGFICADLYNLSRAKTDMERSTSTLSSVLSIQDRLTSAGLEQLIENIRGPRRDNYQIFIAQVRRSGDVVWHLQRGTATGLCDDPFAGSYYSGELPESSPTSSSSEEQQEDKVSMLIVQTCQASTELAMSSDLLGGRIMQSVALDRMQNSDLELAEDLAQEAGLDKEKS